MLMSNEKDQTEAYHKKLTLIMRNVPISLGDLSYEFCPVFRVNASRMSGSSDVWLYVYNGVVQWLYKRNLYNSGIWSAQ